MMASYSTFPAGPPAVQNTNIVGERTTAAGNSLGGAPSTTTVAGGVSVPAAVSATMAPATVAASIIANPLPTTSAQVVPGSQPMPIVPYHITPGASAAVPVTMYPTSSPIHAAGHYSSYPNPNIPPQSNFYHGGDHYLGAQHPQVLPRAPAYHEFGPAAPRVPLPGLKHAPQYSYSDYPIPISSVAEMRDSSRDLQICPMPQILFVGKKNNPTLKDVCENPLVYIEPPRAEEYITRGEPLTPEQMIALVTQSVAYSAVAPKLLDNRYPVLPLIMSYKFDPTIVCPPPDEKDAHCCRRINHLNHVLINYPGLDPAQTHQDRYFR